MLSERQDCLDTHQAKVPISENQQRKFVMQNQVLSSVNQREADTNGRQEWNEGNIMFHRQEPNLKKNTVFRAGKDALFSPAASENFEVGSRIENRNLADDE